MPVIALIGMGVEPINPAVLGALPTPPPLAFVPEDFWTPTLEILTFGSAAGFLTPGRPEPAIELIWCNLSRLAGTAGADWITGAKAFEVPVGGGEMTRSDGAPFREENEEVVENIARRRVVKEGVDDGSV